MLHGKPGQKLLGDDDGCFAHALWCVRTFGGVLEHPEASHAFRFFGLPIPKTGSGWTEPDYYGGRSFCVAQGHYGHRAQKLTWLYALDVRFWEFKRGRCKNMARLDEGFHSSRERAKAKAVMRDRLDPKENNLTPPAFAEFLIGMVKP